MTAHSRTGVVVIGRNEGTRLERCLESLPRCLLDRTVYVDSGSTDHSLTRATQAGVAATVSLDPSRPFTAARARNEGFACLRKLQTIDCVQFIDGDCELDPSWLDAATRFLATHSDIAVVCGRRRERYPGASVYNRLCDWEWDTPVGEARACGGDALMRASAFESAGGFNSNLIAGEEPDLCLRLRRDGWRIWRIADEMTLHDAALSRFSQWWRRCLRGGHAFAEGAALHGASVERFGVSNTRRALVWGLGVPAIAGIAATLLGPPGLAVLLAWPLQVARIALREGVSSRTGWERGFFLTLGKIPEAIGVLGYLSRRWLGRRARIIEYK